ncbi:MAG TPA: hypothetical protein VFZ91_16165 [Allosphingosinicella sp.]
MPGAGTPRWAAGPVAYVRFHGGEGKCWGRYPDETLLGWTDWIGARPAPAAKSGAISTTT